MGIRLSARLDWLDSRSSRQFLCVLYFARWVVLAPYITAEKFLFTKTVPSTWDMSQLSEINPVLLFVIIVAISPLLETFVECSLPYFFLSIFHRKKGKLPARPWFFVIVSAVLMALLHPILSAIVPSLITGAFLAYCYAHFAFRNIGYAIIYTTAFHGAINIIGWTVIVFGGGV